MKLKGSQLRRARVLCLLICRSGLQPFCRVTAVWNNSMKITHTTLNDLMSGSLDDEIDKLLKLRSGGTYVPPAKLRRLQEQLRLKALSEPDATQNAVVQRLEWDKLRKKINGLINKVNSSNIRETVYGIFGDINMVRGRGLFCRYLMRAQSVSSSFTPVYAALVAVVNRFFPEIGLLLVSRLVLQFRRFYRRKNKPGCIAVGCFIAELANQRVIREVLVLELVTLLLLKPAGDVVTDDSVDVAVKILSCAGDLLSEECPGALSQMFENLRSVLASDNSLSTRTIYLVEDLFKERRNGFRDAIPDRRLQLIDEDDQTTHLIHMDDKSLRAHDELNVFKADEAWDASEASYFKQRDEILEALREQLGEDERESESESEHEGALNAEEVLEQKGEPEAKEGSEHEVGSEHNVGSEPEAAAEEAVQEGAVEASGSIQDSTAGVIIDSTNSEQIELRKKIYLTVMSTMSANEATHKLNRLAAGGQQQEVVNMIVECCAQERTYNKMYGAVAETLCKLRRDWHNHFQTAFAHFYAIIHRYNSNQLRNIATLFGYVLASDALGWEVFDAVHMTEEATSSSSRIFVKVLFQEMQQEIGLKEICQRLQEPYMEPYLRHMFVKGSGDDTRFAINYFTAIGLGVLTEDMRAYLEGLSESGESDESDESDDSDDSD